MSSIQVLDQNTINQIAAGEVIERPSSVVKELVENALDAGATAVTVEIKDGGISFIRVTDNGCGIPADEIPRAFLSHSTSKIRSAEDLLTVSSLGFRGEALPSIAAVSQVELITRTQDELTGIRYRMEGGKETGKEEIGAPAGTTFVVRNLFYNTPARKKFLKTPAAEGNAVSGLMEHLALSQPGVSFRFLANNQTKLHTAGSHKLKDIIYTIYGREIARSLLPLHAEEKEVQVDGYIGKPEINRGNRTFENYFVNGRYVKSDLITHAVENAYHGFTMQHKYPFAVFHLTIDPELLDVNVHPAKRELRFAHEEEVYNAVYDGIRRALTGAELIPRHAFEETEKKTEEKSPVRGPEPFEAKRRQEEERERPKRELSTIEKLQQVSARDENPDSQRETFSAPKTHGLVREAPPESAEKSAPEERRTPDGRPAEEERPAAEERPVAGEKRPAAEAGRGEKEEQLDFFEERLLTRQARDEYHLIGQLFGTYWLVEYRDQFLILDQHAAHEKVMYERIMASLKNREYTSQQVQPPLLLSLNDREAQVITDYREHFEKIGFSIEPFGGNEFEVRAVPANLFGIARSDLLTEMIDSLADDAGHNGLMLIEEKIASMSCRAAVKGNHPLSFEEAEALIDELLTLDNPYLCPHGRPTMITMTRHELDRKFKRIVS